MIRINLLPVRAAKRREFGKQQLLLLVLALIIAFGANFFWWKNVNDANNTLDAQIGRTRQEIAQLEKTIGEVKTITQEKNALNDKLKILDDLKKGRTGPVKLMDELSGLIPAKVWLSDYTEQQGAVILRGKAVTYEDLSVFSKKMKASKHFHDVNIKNAKQGSDGVVLWEISCVADYSA
jgi:type IV pilus assembly protein PilN